MGEREKTTQKMMELCRALRPHVFLPVKLEAWEEELQEAPPMEAEPDVDDQQEKALVGAQEEQEEVGFYALPWHISEEKTRR